MKKPKNHDCRRNHSGSLKSMEADMAVELILRNDDLVKENTSITLRKRSILRDEFKVKVALENIIPHAFGEHLNYGSFCTLEDDGTHKYKYFKDEKCLTGLSLRGRLENIIQPFIKSVPQIAQCASKSHCFRVAISVFQKNLGYTFIVNLNQELSLSPKSLTTNFRKKKRSSKNCMIENREGFSYQFGCGYLNTSDLINETLLIDNFDMNDCEMVVFDIETTGLAKTDEIIQIAAIC
ncbi:hypothetical protein TSAR_011772 [Trichomalopsis sarcophagae]|uniref:Exonuclease domain-containing protein n=1 Tax=Trichomalopsis sarcophagae TaxID=543379 RepID=A0A232EG21_9HYME|nr:hypothetical protein TSAR_011772 [Trichomalopsis sarcophagae]